jgi:hypothetical protein
MALSIPKEVTKLHCAQLEMILIIRYAEKLCICLNMTLRSVQTGIKTQGK